MIISRQKNQDELKQSLDGLSRLFLVGCGACATVCKSGGEEEVFQMQEWLATQGIEVTGSAVIDEACHIMRAGRDLRQNRDGVDEADGLLVLACGSGIQSIAISSDKQVIGGLDSMFLGNVRRFGQYEEKCSLCGECILNETAGICPVTTCAKSLLNGPCGGMADGHCEIDQEIDCAWHLIYERLKKQGRPGVFARPVAPKNWSNKQKPGRHKVER